MKTLYLFFALLFLAGAGCSGSSEMWTTEPEEVEEESQIGELDLDESAQIHLEVME